VVFNLLVLSLLGILIIGCCLILANLNILTEDAIKSARSDRDLKHEVCSLRRELAFYREEVKQLKANTRRKLTRIAASSKRKSRFK